MGIQAVWAEEDAAAQRDWPRLERQWQENLAIAHRREVELDQQMAVAPNPEKQTALENEKRDCSVPGIALRQLEFVNLSIEEMGKHYAPADLPRQPVYQSLQLSQGFLRGKLRDFYVQNPHQGDRLDDLRMRRRAEMLLTLSLEIMPAQTLVAQVGEINLADTLANVRLGLKGLDQDQQIEKLGRMASSTQIKPAERLIAIMLLGGYPDQRAVAYVLKNIDVLDFTVFTAGRSDSPASCETYFALGLITKMDHAQFGYPFSPAAWALKKIGRMALPQILESLHHANESQTDCAIEAIQKMLTNPKEYREFVEQHAGGLSKRAQMGLRNPVDL